MTHQNPLSRSSPRLASLIATTLGVAGLIGILPLDPSGTVRVAHAQKGGGITPPPPILPPARYTIQWLEGGPGWDAVFPRDINQWGVVAGDAWDPDAEFRVFSAFAHSDTAGSMNLNELGAPWSDLDAAVPTLATGWRATSASGINDWGDISGNATNVDPNVPSRAFVLEDAFGAARRFLLLPTVATANHYGSRINNHGEVVGTVGSSDYTLIRYQRTGAWPFYIALPQAGLLTSDLSDINDDGVIVTRRITGTGQISKVAYRQLVAGTPADAFTGLEFWCISNGAIPWIGGVREFSGKGKTAVPGGPIRLPVLGTLNDVQILGSSAWAARAINDHGDAVFESSGRGNLFYDAINPITGTRYGTNGDGVLPLDQMVVYPNADWLDSVRPQGITNRDGTGLGIICGFQPFGTRSGFLLIPFVP